MTLLSLFLLLGIFLMMTWDLLWNEFLIHAIFKICILYVKIFIHLKGLNHCLKFIIVSTQLVLEFMCFWVKKSIYNIFISCCLFWTSVDSQPTMEETILVGDDLMTGPPSPIIPPEIASHVLEGVELCDGLLRNLFLCKFCGFN